ALGDGTGERGTAADRDGGENDLRRVAGGADRQIGGADVRARRLHGDGAARRLRAPQADVADGACAGETRDFTGNVPVGDGGALRRGLESAREGEDDETKPH